MTKLKKLILYCGIAIFTLLVTNWITTSIIYNFKYPYLTEKEVFLRTPQHFVWDFSPPVRHVKIVQEGKK